MIKKIALPLLVGGAVLGFSSIASADLLYAGLGLGVSVTGQDQGMLQIQDQMPIEVKTKPGSISGSIFAGFAPLPFFSVEGDFEYTEVNNKIKQDSAWEQAIYGDKPVTTQIISPFLNVVAHSPTIAGVGLFALAGVGASYMSTSVSSENPEYDPGFRDKFGYINDTDYYEYEDNGHVKWEDGERVVNPDNDGQDDDGNKIMKTTKYTHFSPAYDFGVGVFYQVPTPGINVITVSGGFRYINLGSKYSQTATDEDQTNFSIKPTTKEEVFLRVQVGF